MILAVTRQERHLAAADRLRRPRPEDHRHDLEAGRHGARRRRERAHLHGVGERRFALRQDEDVAQQDLAKKMGYKEAVFFTDGFFSPPTKPEGVRILWVISPGGTTDNLPFGTVIRMRVEPD